MFYSFAYIVPEILPALIILYVVMSTPQPKASSSGRVLLPSGRDMTAGELDQPLLQELDTLGSDAPAEAAAEEERRDRAEVERPVDDFFDDGTQPELHYSDIEDEEIGKLRAASIVSDHEGDE